MKILFVGVFKKNSTNIGQANSFEELGHEVVRYDYRVRVNQLGSYDAMEQELIKKCVGECPQLTFFSKCNRMSVGVINKCNNIGKTGLWYMDPMHNFDSELIQKINAATFTCCALWEPYHHAKKYNKNSYFVHEGFDEKIFKVSSFYLNQIYDISFIGSLYGNRLMYSKAIKFRIFFNMFGEDHNRVVNSTKINLNFISGGSSDRVYKILAAKGFLLTESWPYMENDFKIGRDLDVFTNVRELEKKIKFYLERPKERLRIATAGYYTVQKFTTLNWSKRILEIYKENVL